MSTKHSQTQIVPSAPAEPKSRKDSSRMMGILIVDVLAARKVTPVKKAVKKDKA